MLYDEASTRRHKMNRKTQQDDDDDMNHEFIIWTFLLMNNFWQNSKERKSFIGNSKTVEAWNRF